MRLTVVSSLFIGCALVCSAEAQTRAPAAGVTQAYRIGPEDLLDISVWNNTAVDRVVPVRPDGKISLPLVGDVQAGGLTPFELRDALRLNLVAFIPDAEVSVVVREVHSFKVSVLGQVKLPGRYELKSSTTVLDALALAGGFTDFAVRSRILVIRQTGTTSQRIQFNYSEFVDPGHVGVIPTLQPGDLIVVP